MATGRPPFLAEHGEAILYQVLHADPPRPSSLRSELPAGLEGVILRCLRKEPADRFADCHGVIDGLKGIEVPRPSTVPQSAPGLDVQPSLAVLPFADMSPARDHEYFAEGLAEELIHALARIQGVRVVARTSSFALQGMKLDVRDIGKKLDVSAVLEGSIRKAGNRLRVTAQLIDARTGLHLWSERFDREEIDVFAIQDEISLAIVDHLKVTLVAGEKASLQRRTTADPEAYNLYLKGLYFVARPNPESIGRALGFFHAAIERDPTFALAHAGVATVFSTLGIMNLAPATEMYPKSKAALAQAFALDPDLAEAHALAAVLALWFEWNWAAAEESFQRVLAIKPGDAMSRGQYAWLLLNQRRFDESLREITHALSLDPLMPLYYAWSIALHAAVGRLDEALQEFSRLLEIDPGFGLAYFHAGMAYFRKGLYDDAIRTLEKGRQMVSYPGWGDGMLTMCYVGKGDWERVHRILDEMPEAERNNPSSPCGRAWGEGLRGNLDEAFRWLDAGIERHDILMPFVHIYTENLVPAMARDPRFERILTRMNLPRRVAGAVNGESGAVQPSVPPGRS
jgi:serine/threonine-protein kinase